MGKPTGFLEYERKDGPVRPEAERTADFREFHMQLPPARQREQAARCMDCGIPFCQGGVMIAGMASGCPLRNLVPEINDLVYRGRMAEAYRRLMVTHSFPEFTSRVCPALCEAACTCGVHDAPVSTKENEKAVIEYAYAHGLVEEAAPAVRTGKRVAVVGSGPSGLAAAQLLNRRGHEVTVYERRDRIGGLLRYGIPNMKLDKSLIDRRIALMEEAGVRFVVNADVGRDVDAAGLMKEYDSVILACGASHPRDISAPGRDAEGIFFAVDFLGNVTKRLLDCHFETYPEELAKDKDVIVIGGGASGLVAALGAAEVLAQTENGGTVTVLEKMPKAGRKVMITGKGRCNFTSVKEWGDFSDHVRTDTNFVSPAWHNLPPEKLIGLFQANGLKSVVERGDRAFPESHLAGDVVDTLLRACTLAGVKVVTGCEVKTIDKGEKEI